MSHITEIEGEILSLDALEAGASRLGGTLHRNVKSFVYWSTTNQGNCDHVLCFPKASYEIGVIANKNGTFKLQWDNYPCGGLVDIVGQDASKLLEYYGVELSKSLLSLEGAITFNETIMADGGIMLEAFMQ